VRAILRGELYRGVVVWNRTKKRDVTGDVHPTRRAKSEWHRIDRPELRIVSDEQWEAAHIRIGRFRTTATGTAVRRDYDSKYLLTGFVRCATCGGSIGAVSRSHGRQRAYFYGCQTNWKKGASICTNDLVLPINRVNDAVLKALAGDVLRPAGGQRHH
jgi:site-specific DNA recombinase